MRADAVDRHIIWVRFPRLFDDSYIQPDVKLEIGPLALWNPNDLQTLSSFVSSSLPSLNLQEASVPTIKAERTFWEKLTILHHEHHRPEGSQVPVRYSRHYYDVYKLGHSPIKERALSQVSLLEEVVTFKKRFYPRGWAQYDAAVLGTLRLLPAPHSMERLARDYEQMKAMIFSDYPVWEDILCYLEELEQELNH